MDEINNLIAIKSIFELNQGYNNLNVLLSKISDKYLAQRIINEVKRRNFGNITLIIEKYLFDNVQHTVTYDLNDIRQFDFDYIENTELNHIKAKLGLTELNLNKVETAEGNETNYYRHWDNLNRFAIVLEKNLVQEIKTNPEINLNLIKELVVAKLGYYTKFTIEKYDPNIAKVNASRDYDEYDRQTYEDYNGSYAQDYGGYSDQQINDIFDGDPDLYWNID